MDDFVSLEIAKKLKENGFDWEYNVVVFRSNSY